jgi:hypothetical protein
MCTTYEHMKSIGAENTKHEHSAPIDFMCLLVVHMFCVLNSYKFHVPISSALVCSQLLSMRTQNMCTTYRHMKSIGDENIKHVH